MLVRQPLGYFTGSQLALRQFEFETPALNPQAYRQNSDNKDFIECNYEIVRNKNVNALNCQLWLLNLFDKDFRPLHNFGKLKNSLAIISYLSSHHNY